MTKKELAERLATVGSLLFEAVYILSTVEVFDEDEATVAEFLERCRQKGFV